MVFLGIFNSRRNLNGEEVLNGRTPENKINDELNSDLDAIKKAIESLENKPKDKSNPGILSLSLAERQREMQMREWIKNEQALLSPRKEFIENQEP